MLKRIPIWLDRFERMITALTAIILGLLALLVGWQVISRYLLHTGLFWAEELALVAMMWATLLGAAGCIQTDSHVRLNVVIGWFPKIVRVWILTFMDGVIVWFAFLMMREGMKLVQRTMGGTMSALGIPIGTTYYIVPVAAVMMILFTVIKLISRIVRHYSGRGGER